MSYQLILSTEQNGLPNVTVSVTTDFHKFLGIEEFTVYSCIVAATNGVGQGQFSSPISFTTSESGTWAVTFGTVTRIIYRPS